MTPQTMAMMYAMNVGIGALSGKRGSNLWKDAFRDTTIMALTGEMLGPQQAGADQTKNMAMQAAPEITGSAIQTGPLRATEAFDITKTLTEGGKKLTEQEKIIQQLPFLEKGAKTYSTTPPAAEGWRGWFDKGAGVFKSEKPVMTAEGQQFQLVRDAQGAVRSVPVTAAQTDRLKVGLGAGALGAGLYGAGMFDPVPPPEPKYPGYNKFYAQNPGQFMPYDDPNIDPIDYSQYPDKPYSGIKKGGIIGLQAGGPPPAEMSDNDFALMLFNKPIDQLQPHQLEALQPYLQNKKEGGIAAFAKGGRAANQPHQDVFEATTDEEEEERKRRQQGIGRAPGPAPRIPYEQDGGIGGYGPGRRAMPEGTYAPTPQVDPRWFHPDNPRFLRPDVQGVKTGALIHRLPSKTKVDENNPKNYKRTSGKLVVDRAGKGSENKDTMLAQLADGEFVTKSKAVRGAGLALGADPKNKKQQKDLGARYFYKQMAEFDKLAKRMAS